MGGRDGVREGVGDGGGEKLPGGEVGRGTWRGVAGEGSPEEGEGVEDTSICMSSSLSSSLSFPSFPSSSPSVSTCGPSSRDRVNLGSIALYISLNDCKASAGSAR